MKSTVFDLIEYTTEEAEYSSPIHPIHDFLFKVPVLPAYSVMQHSVDQQHINIFEELRQAHDYEIKGDIVRIKACRPIILHEPEARLTIYYAGIRDYALLFPHVKKKKLRDRLGQYAEEAEKAFDSGAWMSYVVMAGAVIEGLLFNTYGGDGFKDLIKQAKKEDLFDAGEIELMNEVRLSRNRLHAKRFSEPFVDRQIAMDLYLIYDRLIKKVWV